MRFCTKDSPVPTHPSISFVNDQCSMTPQVPQFERIITYIFPVRLSVLVRSHICPIFARTFFNCLYVYYNIYLPFISKDYTFNKYFNLIKLYTPIFKLLYSLIGMVKVNLIHKDIIFAVTKYGCLKYHILANNAFC